MDAKQIMKIFEETAYVRVGGRPEELKTAEYILDQVAKLGLSAVEGIGYVAEFEVVVAIYVIGLEFHSLTIYHNGGLCGADAGCVGGYVHRAQHHNGKHQSDNSFFHVHSFLLFLLS